MAMQYDPAGRRTRLTWPDGFFVGYGYDVTDAMTAIRQGAGQTLIAAYAYDDLGRRASVSRGNGVTTTYGYDPASRLTSLNHDLPGTANDQSYGYNHNPAGQIHQLSSSNDNYAYDLTPGTDRYGIDGLNRITDVDATGLGYDANGNLTDDGTRGYGYDAANRLRTTNNNNATLAYDALGRLERMVGTAGGRYLYDGAEITGVVTAATGTAIDNRLVRGPWPDELVVAYQGSGADDPRWSLQDHLSSTIAGTDATGTATSINRYDDYGRPRAGNAGRMQYTGQLWLPDFGLYHYKARAYHPGLGRFVQTDPIGYAAGANLYAYVTNDPINWTDPMGLQQTCPPNDPRCNDATTVGDVVVTGRRIRPQQTFDLGILDVIGRIRDFVGPGVGIGEGSNTATCANPSLTSSEAAAAARGDRISYWRSRERRSDPIARTALAITLNRGMGMLANSNLRLGIARRNLQTGYAQTGRSIDAEINQIGVGLMQSHAALTALGGQISAPDHAQYHHEVFARHHLAASTFGGTPFLGLTAEASLTAPAWLSC